MTTDSYEDLFKRAAEIASVVPEPMQDAAFQRALNILQEEQGASNSRQAGSTRRRGAKQKSSASSKSDATDSAQVLIEGINRTDHAEVGEAPKVLERSLYVLKIAKDEFGIDGLTANEIASVLTEKFRLRTTRQRVNQVLDGASSLVDRKPGSGRSGARYRIMAPGEKHLENPPTSEDSGSKAAKPSPKKRGPRRAARKPARKRTSTKRRGRALGPRAALETLVDDGFLDGPRTIGELRDRLESKKGRSFKVTDLSPALTRMLRDGSLDREKNDDGQYEYQRK